MKWLLRALELHLWPDPVLAILGDLAIALVIVFGVLLISYQVSHGGHYPW